MTDDTKSTIVMAIGLVCGAAVEVAHQASIMGLIFALLGIVGGAILSHRAATKATFGSICRDCDTQQMPDQEKCAYGQDSLEESTHNTKGEAR